MHRLIRRLIIAVVPLALVTAVTTMAVASPQAAAKRHFGNKHVCSYRATGSGCMAANGTSGDNVNSKTFDPNSTNQFTDALQQPGQCNNGFVTSTCPFTSGLHLNDRFSGDEIVTLDRHASANDPFQGNPGNLDVTQNSSHILFVINGDCSSTDPTGCQFVPVYASDQLNTYDHYYAVCDEGTDIALGLETNPAVSRCRWFQQP